MLTYPKYRFENTKNAAAPDIRDHAYCNTSGSVGEAMENSSALPDKTQVWDNLSNALILIAGDNHELNMCRRNKADRNKDYKALCNNKHPVERTFFGSDLIECLKTVKASNKAPKQLTKYQSSFTKPLEQLFYRNAWGRLKGTPPDQLHSCTNKGNQSEKRGCQTEVEDISTCVSHK